MVVVWERLDGGSFVADTDNGGIAYRLTAEQTHDGALWEWLAWPSGFPDLARGGEAVSAVTAMSAAEAAANAGDASSSPGIMIARV